MITINVVGYSFFISHWKVPWVPVGRKLHNIVFYRNVHNFPVVNIASKTFHLSVTKGFLMDFERLKMCSSNTPLNLLLGGS